MSRRCPVIWRAVVGTAVIVAALGGILVAQRSGPLSDEDVASAITLGRANKMNGIVTRCEARKPSTSVLLGLTGLYGLATQALVPGNNVFLVELSTAKGHIASMAWAASRAGQVFTADAVTADDRAPGLFITIAPRLPGPTESAMLPANVLGVEWRALREVRDEVFQPSSPITTEPRVWRNNEGATVDYRVTKAVFTRATLMAMPPAEMRLMIATEAGVRSCEFSQGEFAKLVKAAR